MNENLILKTLRVRPFSYLILSEFFSQFAMNLFNFVLLILVFRISSSNTAVSGVVIAFTIPSLIFGVLAGVLVDRWNKKYVLLVTNILRALLIFPLYYFHQNLAVIYAVTFFVSVITQFFIPAETPIIPQLVRKELLLSANALFGMGIYVSIFLAYAMSGPFLFLLGQKNIFTALALFFLIAGFFASLIKINKIKQYSENLNNVKQLTFKEEITIVVNLIKKTKALYHALFSLTLAQILIFVLAVIGPGYAVSVLRIEVERFPILFVTPAIMGVALGAVIIGNFLHKVSKSLQTKFGLFLLGISILLLPYGSKVESREIIQFINLYLPNILIINVLHIMIFLAFVLGFATAFIFVPANTIIQEETSDELRGKVYGILNTFIGIMSLAPVILVGGLADIIGVKSVITILGISVLIIAFIRTFILDRE
ncbi:MAG: MFS transporter [Patescibacteria group bacterium]